MSHSDVGAKKMNEDIRKWSDEKLDDLLSKGDPNTTVWRRAQEESGRRKSEEVRERHIEATQIAKGANHIAKWAIVIAVIALIVAIVQTFWRQ